MTGIPDAPGRRRLLAATPGLVLAAMSCRVADGGGPSPRALTYVAIGASDSVGVGATTPEQESWPAVLHRRLPPGSHLVNLGVSGSLLRQALDQQLPVALESGPDLVTVWLAVNDYGARVPLEPYLADLRTMLRELRSKTRATTLVGNVPDLSALPAAGRFDVRFIDRWNQGIAETIREHEAILVDLRTTWTEVREHPEYISSDGFHPSTSGYQRLADRFYTQAAPPLGLTG
jgi:acyl-CoA thioesterase I